MAQKSNSFATAKQSVIIRPRTAESLAFIYHGFADLKNLIAFVGTKPTIDEDGKLWFRKQQIPDNCVVVRNSYAQVTDVLSFDKAEEQYILVSDSEFKPEHANKVVARVLPEGNGERKMTKEEIQAELTKMKVDFPKWNVTRDQLQAILDKAKAAKK